MSWERKRWVCRPYWSAREILGRSGTRRAFGMCGSFSANEVPPLFVDRQYKALASLRSNRGKAPDDFGYSRVIPAGKYVYLALVAARWRERKPTVPLRQRHDYVPVAGLGAGNPFTQL